MPNAPKKILVAEDDLASGKILRTLLEKWGFQVLTATDGRQAWEVFRGDPDIHIIVSDWMMPDVDGVELCRLVRNLEGRRYTYFILLTAKSQIGDVVSGLEAGADDFVTKPFNQYELRVRIRAGERVVDLETQLANKVEELSRAYRQMRRDLEAAATMQRSMLPVASGELPGMVYASRYIPSQEVGGDLFNLVRLDASRLGVYIFDVSGHGIPAALQSVAMGRMLSTADLQTGLLFAGDESEGGTEVLSPREVARKLNSRFQSASSKGDFITFLYGVLDTKAATLTYTRAGHPCPVHVSNGSVVEIADLGDIPIGIIPHYDYAENTLNLTPGDRLYFFTDGIAEAANSRRERFGEQRMHEYLESASGLTLDESVNGLVQRVLEWRDREVINDDMSILGIEVRF